MKTPFQMNAVEFWNDVAMEVHRRDFLFHDLADEDELATPMDRQTTPSVGGPTRVSRAFAIVHLAMIDAWYLLQNIQGMSGTFTDNTAGVTLPTSAKLPEAAIGGAAAAVLKSFYPKDAGVKGFITRRAEEWRVVSIAKGLAEADVAANVAFGAAIGDLLFQQRMNDGGQKPESKYNAMNVPGAYQPDPYALKEMPLGAQWGSVTPFGFQSLSGITFEPPLGKSAVGDYVTSPGWAAQVSEVREFGAEKNAQGLKRTPEQTIIGLFWAYDGARAIGVPPRLYNQCLRAIAEQATLTEEQTLVLLAIAHMGMANAGIAAWHEKYRYQVARPVTGIREAALAISNIGFGFDPNTSKPTFPSGTPPLPINPVTYANVEAWLSAVPTTPTMQNGDVTWAPLGAPQTNTARAFNRTPGFPAYPSGHATFGAVCFEIARLVLEKYRPDLTQFEFEFVSDELSGQHRDSDGSLRTTHRRTLTLAQAIHENAWSRIYLGVHWPMDAVEGVSIGMQITAKTVASGKGPTSILGGTTKPAASVKTTASTASGSKAKTKNPKP